MAVTLNGSSQNVSLGNVLDGIDWRITGGTWCAWIKTSYTGAYQSIWNNILESAPFPGWEFSVEITTGKLWLTVISQTTQIQRIASPASVATGVWTHVAATRLDTGSAVGSNLYVDGSAVTPTIVINTPHTSAATSGVAARIGSRATQNYFNGAVADVRMYDRALSAQEIATIYHSRGCDGIVQGLRVRHQLGGSGTVTTANCKDIGPNHLDAASVAAAPSYSAGVLRIA